MADRESDKRPAPPVAERPEAKEVPGPEDKTAVFSAEEKEEVTPSRPQYQPPYLVIVEGPRTGSRFPLGDGPNVIGRAPNNAVHLDDQSVSRQHAEVLRSESGWAVRDLGSKNGTLVNGRPITESVVVGHKDVIKTGIYQLRLITQSISLEEEMTLPPELAMADRTVFVAAPPEVPTTKMEERELPPGPPPAEEVVREGGPPPKPPARRRTLVFMGALGLVVIAAAAFFAHRILFKPPPKPPKVSKPPAEVVPPPPEVPGPPQAAKPLPPEAVAPAPQTIPVFLDFASSPMPVKVTFQDKELGTTPLRVNVDLEPGKEYTAHALFVMPEIKEQYTQDVGFTVDKDSTVIPILFRGPIGMIKVEELPRDVEFYLEGKFTYDRFKEQSAKLSEIVLRKPIYIPYGDYNVELRRARQLGETALTFVKDIIFQRKFIIAEDSPTYVIAVKEEDLSVFPVKIRSEPSGADVFIDGKRVGQTPFEGPFPLGEHKLVLRKEGYFEHSETLKMDINTPYMANVRLKTSVAGAHINNARLAMNRAMYQEAINELAEALNSQPAPSEVALARYLLGTCYLNLNDIPRAMGYFEQAKEHEDWRHPAMLGLVHGHATMKQMDRALPLLVEVLLKTEDEKTKKEANDLFQKISPFRSVIYVYSEPAGAQVVVNDNPVAQKTPVILHDLPLGNYRIRVEKPGYLPTELSLSLSVNEFNPVIVKLRPIPE